MGITDLNLELPELSEEEAATVVGGALSKNECGWLHAQLVTGNTCASRAEFIKMFNANCTKWFPKWEGP